MAPSPKNFCEARTETQRSPLYGKVMSPGILAIQGCHDKAGSQLILLTMGIGLDCRLGDFFLERFLLLGIV
ncbi:MAG: hypothetical protein D4R76_08045 [Methylococcus sp.]|nr:MAG: hypothetical protein D4R76_08045 [Methylococcus sp.]